MKVIAMQHGKTITPAIISYAHDRDSDEDRKKTNPKHIFGAFS